MIMVRLEKLFSEYVNRMDGEIKTLKDDAAQAAKEEIKIRERLDKVERLGMMAEKEECPNCHALVPSLKNSTMGPVCCAACLFHPLGCRCKWGDYGEPEEREWYNESEG